MLRKALCLALIATPLAFGVSCEDKKKPLPPPTPAATATTPAAVAPSGSGVDRRVEGATKAMQQAASKREKQLDNVGK